MSKLSKIIATGLIAAGAFAASAAQAGALFTVNPNSNGLTANGLLTYQQFDADQLSGVSSARITQTSPTFDYKGVGYISYDSFALNSGSVRADTSGLNLDYGMYATFTQTFSCSAQLAVNTSCSVTSISLNLYAENLRDGSVKFNNATTSSDATVDTTGAGTQILLGTVNFGVGTAGIDDKGGAFQNVNTNLDLTAAGKLFFVKPVPFFTMTFNAFNNTSTGLQTDGAGHYAIKDESGTTTFGNAVPEPGSLALFGLALAGVAAAGRRKTK